MVLEAGMRQAVRPERRQAEFAEAMLWRLAEQLATIAAPDLRTAALVLVVPVVAIDATYVEQTVEACSCLLRGRA
jgi:hypothetical protein